MRSILTTIFGAFIGFLIGKLSKSFEIILIALPIGAFLGYKFSHYFSRFFIFLFELFKKIAPSLFKQVP
jgi:hypothetical protein